jgi:flagellar hook-length control protein FliK
MQKMTNVLLASNKAESQPSSEIKQAASNDSKSSGNNDFSTALKHASIDEKQSVNANSSEVSRSNGDKNATNALSSDSEALVEQNTDVESIDLDNESNSDLIDVSHVLAQISLAAELSSANNAKVNGDSLPLDEMLIEDTSIEAMVASLNIEVDSTDDNILRELVDKSGLSKEELEALAPEILSQLIALVKSGGSHYQDIIDNSKHVEVLNPERIMAGKASDKDDLKAVTTGNDTKPVPVDQLKALEISKETSSALQSKESLLASNRKATNIQGSDLASSDKGEGIKFNTILGEKQASQTGVVSPSNKLLTEGQITSEEQLKGAELSVKLTPMKAGVELVSAFTETESVVESKLQQTSSLLTPQQASRSDIAQIHLSLKQGNEQQVNMQEMIQRFAPVMKQQLITMVSQGIQHAEIRLDPPELGQLMVRIQVQGDQTQVQFNVAQHQTRDLIEQAIPRLKDLLAEQGMQLIDSQVSQDNKGDGAEGEQSSEEGGSQFGSELDEMSSEESLISSKQATSYPSGIDYYA